MFGWKCKGLSEESIATPATLDDTAVTAEAKYSIIGTRSRKKFCLSITEVTVFCMLKYS